MFLIKKDNLVYWCLWRAASYVTWFGVVMSVYISLMCRECVCVCSSEEWQKIVKSDREKIGLTFDNDGEFWSVILLSVKTAQWLWKILNLLTPFWMYMHEHAVIKAVKHKVVPWKKLILCALVMEVTHEEINCWCFFETTTTCHCITAFFQDNSSKPVPECQKRNVSILDVFGAKDDEMVVTTGAIKCSKL